MALPSGIRVLETEELGRIHDASLKILRRTGVIFQSDEVLAAFRHRGARVQGQTVFLNARQVDEALGSCPRSFTLWGRREENTLLVGRGQQGLLVSPGNGTVFVQQGDHRRPALMRDFIDIARLCQHSSVVHLAGSIPVDPGDVPLPGKPLRLLHQLLRFTHKPLIGVAVTQQEARECFQLMELAFGRRGFLDDHAAIVYSVNPASPLKYEPLSCETILAYAKRGQVLCFLPGIMAGLTGPLDLWALTILMNVEILAGIVCAQFVRPGTPVVYSSGAMMANMSRANVITGSPESGLVNIAGLQMAREFYHLPARTMAGLTDAKLPDYQAGCESMQNLLLLTLGGAQIINECLGVLDAINTTSFEKWILDEEMISRALRILEGMPGGDADAAVQTIQEVAHWGSYLTHDHTLKNCRRAWRPAISDWDEYEAWRSEERPDILDRAGRRCREILDNCRQPLIDTELDRELGQYIRRRYGQG